MRRLPALLLSLLVCAALFALPAAAQSKRAGENTVRSVQGVVTDASGTPVNGAVVQLANTKTQQIRSFITRGEGNYYFHGLSSDVDFELRAELADKASATRTLSTWDTRKEASINLKLDKKK